MKRGFYNRTFSFLFFLFLNCQSIKKVFTFFCSGWLVGIISNFSLRFRTNTLVSFAFLILRKIVKRSSTFELVNYILDTGKKKICHEENLNA